MLALVNTNRMQPPIAPLGLEYVAAAADAARIPVEVLDLCFSADIHGDIKSFFATRQPRLVGLSFRNLDDSFWPSAQWFLPGLAELVQAIRQHTEAPLVLGGVGFSIMAPLLMKRVGVDFGIHGDGEAALVGLYHALNGREDLKKIPGLYWRNAEALCANPPAWPAMVSHPPRRGFIDNARYFKLGGQGGIETKRGCDRACLYCADPLAKGRRVRLRPLREIADEAEHLLALGVDVLHLCDGEFNIPLPHAKEVCREWISRGLGSKLRWYAYLAITPFDEELAWLMRRAGCVGLNFTTDSAVAAMLKTYRHGHTRYDIAQAVGLAKQAGLTVMLDLLLGGPGETPETAKESIHFFKSLAADAIGAGLGVRIYPGTAMEKIARQADAADALRRRYTGALDLVQPTFYISPLLGANPAGLIKQLIGGDPRFFPPAEESQAATDHNYNDNRELADAIQAGARGAYWDILRQMRTRPPDPAAPEAP